MSAFSSRATLLLAIIALLPSTVVAGQGDPAELIWRQPTAREIETLFRVSIYRPNKSTFVADIENRRPAWTTEQVEQEMVRQEELLKRRNPGRRPASQELIAARRNGITKAHNGLRIVHLRAWYSGDLQRVDLTDEGIPYSHNRKFVSPDGYDETLVDTNDVSFSEISSFRMTHPTKSIQFTRGARTRLSTTFLWQIVSVPIPLLEPLLKALAKDSKTLQYPYARTDNVEISPRLVRNMVDGGDTDWRMTVARTTDGTHYRLEGTIVKNSQMVTTIANYLLTDHAGGRAVSAGSRQDSDGERNEFSAADYQSMVPKKYELKWVSPKTKIASSVTFLVKHADLNPKFDLKEVFNMPRPEGYSIADVTTGSAQYLPGAIPPSQAARSLEKKQLDEKREYAIAALGLITITAGYFLLGRKKA